MSQPGPGKTTIVLSGEEIAMLQRTLGYAIEFASIKGDGEQEGDWVFTEDEEKAHRQLDRKLEKAMKRTLQR